MVTYTFDTEARRHLFLRAISKRRCHESTFSIRGNTSTGESPYPIDDSCYAYRRSGRWIRTRRSFRGTDTRIELTQFVSSGGDLVLFFWANNTDNETSFEAAVLDQPAVATLTHLGGISEKNLYRIEWENGVDGFLDAIADNDLIVEGTVGADGEWVFQLRTHDYEALSAFHDDCIEKDIPLDVYRITAASDSAADTRYDLGETPVAE